MATEKVKKPRKPRRKKTETDVETKSISKGRKKAVENAARTNSTDISVLFKNRMQLHELSTLTEISSQNLLSEISIDTSKAGISTVSSFGTPLYKFSGIKSGNLKSDVSALLDNSAAKRYHTEANDLSAHDLKIFSEYRQQGDKKTYFKDHPYVVHDIDINSLQYEQLLTKGNLYQAERYFINRFLATKSRLKTFNWETDPKDGKLKNEISGFQQMLNSDKWDSQATYKFEWGNDKRTTNIVDLDIHAAYYYSVIGIVSVKSILPDQKSGTIYLEAKHKDSEDTDENWIVIDSAVFKFAKERKDVGTYVTLTGYMSPGYVTRLRLNLHPKAYSMNNWEYREKGSVSNHYSNTFVGSVFIPDDVIADGEDPPEIPVNITFSDANYKIYKVNNTAINVDITEHYRHIFEDVQVKRLPVNEIIDVITTQQPVVSALNIGSNTITRISNFVINGLRYSPTGKVYKRGEYMNLFSNCKLFPSYSSGTITVTQSSLPTLDFDNPEDCTDCYLDNGKILDNLDLTRLTALPNLDWPEDTEICGNHIVTAEMVNVVEGDSGTDDSPSKKPNQGPLKIKDKVESSASYDPRVDNQLITHRVDFREKIEKITQLSNLYGKLSFDITAEPSTYGNGTGGESWGRIRYGDTSKEDRNEIDTNAKKTIISCIRLNTKNISRWITDGMCTGNYWGVTGRKMEFHNIKQSYKYPWIFIQACADTAYKDTATTYFSLSITAKMKFNYKIIIPGKPAEEDKRTSARITTKTTGTTELIEDNQPRHIYPSSLYESHRISTEITPQAGESINEKNFYVNEITARAQFNSNSLSVVPHPQNTYQ